MREGWRTDLETEVFDILGGKWSKHNTDALLVSKYFVSCFRQRTRELAWKLFRKMAAVLRAMKTTSPTGSGHVAPRALFLCTH
jgi:hypothetical protein